jgi:hypothetical protein
MSLLDAIFRSLSESAHRSEMAKKENAEKCTIKGDDFRDKIKYELFQLKLQSSEMKLKCPCDWDSVHILESKIRLYEEEIIRWK